MKMKLNEAIKLLRAEADKYKAHAASAALTALHKAADGKTINDKDARLIRDHELRAEAFNTAATIIS